MPVQFCIRGELTDIDHQLKVVEQILERLRGADEPIEKVTVEEVRVGAVEVETVEVESLPTAIAPDQVLLSECRFWANRAKDNLARVSCLDYSLLDLAWNAVREVRHRFCLLLPADELYRVALDVGDDLAYLDAHERKAALKEWRELDGQLRLYAENGVTDRDALRPVRAKLLMFSYMGANAKQEHWHRVNLLRARLLRTALAAIVAVLALVVGYFRYVEVNGPVRLGKTDISISEPPWLILGVIVAGAVGGFISAVRQHEPLMGASSVFYRERMFLWLRPFVGATAALVLYLAQISGAISFLDPSEHVPAFYLFVAFCTGFSEKFFLSKLEGFLKRKDKQKGSKADGEGADTVDE